MRLSQADYCRLVWLDRRGTEGPDLSDDFEIAIDNISGVYDLPPWLADRGIEF